VGWERKTAELLKHVYPVSIKQTPWMQAKAEYKDKFETLISAIKTESIEECRLLLDKWDDKAKRIVLTMADAQGYAAIHHAVSRSLHRILAVLLDSVPKQQEMACTTSTSPDMISSIPCTPTALVNMTDSKGLTPLHLAAQAGCVDCGMVSDPTRCLLSHLVIYITRIRQPSSRLCSATARRRQRKTSWAATRCTTPAPRCAPPHMAHSPRSRKSGSD
jgi:hypothetical protein